MPWDLIFYGAMATIFVGLMVSSSRARRGRKAGPPGIGNPKVANAADRPTADAGRPDGGDGGT